MLCHLCVIMAAHRNDEKEWLKLWTKASWPDGPKSLNDAISIIAMALHHTILTAHRPTDRPTDSVHRICRFHCLMFLSFNFSSIIRDCLPSLFSAYALDSLGNGSGHLMVVASCARQRGRLHWRTMNGEYAQQINTTASHQIANGAGAIFSLRALPTAAPFFPRANGIRTPLDVNFWYTWAQSDSVEGILLPLFALAIYECDFMWAWVHVLLIRYQIEIHTVDFETMRTGSRVRREKNETRFHYWSTKQTSIAFPPIFLCIRMMSFRLFFCLFFRPCRRSFAAAT